MSDITTPPTKAGPFGRMWTVDLDEAAAALGVKNYATLGSWIIEARWAHPLWHSYNLCLFHLRPVEGLQKPRLYRPDATHEFILFALDPAKPREAMLRGLPAWLHAANFAAQLVEESDEAAVSTIERTIDRIIAGQLNPDTDALSQWVGLFGDAMVKR